MMALFPCKSSLKICMTPPTLLSSVGALFLQRGLACTESCWINSVQPKSSVPSVTHRLQAGDIPLPLHSREDFLMSGGPVTVGPCLPARGPN